MTPNSVTSHPWSWDKGHKLKNHFANFPTPVADIPNSDYFFSTNRTTDAVMDQNINNFFPSANKKNSTDENHKLPSQKLQIEKLNRSHIM